MQLDKDFHPKLNNVAKVSVYRNVFVFFHGVCSVFTLSHDFFFYKAQAWVVLSLSLKRKYARIFVGLKNGLGLTSCKAQKFELQAGALFIHST